MSRLTFVSGLILLCSGWAEAGASGSSRSPEGPQQQRATVDSIANDCGLPASSLVVQGGDLLMRPPPDASFESVDCMLRKLREADLPLRLGFVGNEAPEQVDANAQTH